MQEFKRYQLVQSIGGEVPVGTVGKVLSKNRASELYRVDFGTEVEVQGDDLVWIDHE